MLAVDTATEICGVALAVDGVVQVELSLNHGQTHNKFVMEAIRSVLALGQVELSGIDAFAVTQGPGGFTGLRIGISTVKGLVAATGKPLVGVSSLAVLARQAGGDTELVCPMMDARRNEVYWAIYRRQGQELIVQQAEQVGPADGVARHINAPCFFIGNGVQIYAEKLEAHINHPAQWASKQWSAIRPSVVAELGWHRLQQGQTDAVGTFAPVYLRKSDAEMNRKIKA